MTETHEAGIVLTNTLDACLAFRTLVTWVDADAVDTLLACVAADIEARVTDTFAVNAVVVQRAADHSAGVDT